MSNVNNETAPASAPLKASDFLATPAAKAAPLGGFNELMVDSTAVMNLPNGPDGKRMVARWVYPHQIPMYKANGMPPVSVSDFKRFGLVASANDLNMAPDGLVYRDRNMLVLVWTTHTRNQEVMEKMDEVTKMAQGARSRMYIEAAERSKEEFSRKGIMVRDEDVESGDVVPDDFQAYSDPVEKRPARISLTGAKQ